MGGRPSAPITLDPGPCPPSKSESDHLRYHIVDQDDRMDYELGLWEDFREYQKGVRRPEEFEKYVENVREHRQDTGIEWDVELREERQTKLDEWKEYYLYELRQLPDLERNLQLSQELPEPELHWPLTPEETKDRLEQQQRRLKWIEGEFPKIMATSNQTRRVGGECNIVTEPPITQPSSSRSVPEAVQCKLSTKAARSKKLAANQSILSPANPSKVTKVALQARSLGNTSRHRVSSAENRAIEEQGDVRTFKASRSSIRRPYQEQNTVRHPISHSNSGLLEEARLPPQKTLRRSERISSLAPTRRSSRIRQRMETQLRLPNVSDATPPRLKRTARRRSQRRNAAHTDTTYTGKPQGISKRGGRKSKVN